MDQQDTIPTLPEPETARRRKVAPIWKRVLRSLLFLCGLLLGMCWMLAWDTVRAKPHKLNRSPKSFGLPYENVAFPSKDGTLLRGWLIPAAGRAKGIIVCCHGVDSTRLAMLKPALLLHDAGYAVLLFDFRARGESGGRLCTLGYRETDDLLAAIATMQARPEMKSTPVGVLGESMGGAVALMGTARNPAIRCVVAESPFACLDHAVANHFRSILGGGGPFLGVPTRWFGERFIGHNCDDIAPLREIAKIAPRPLLLIEDGVDSLCPTAETQALLREAGTPKQIWTVPEADHIEAKDVQPDEYARHLITFFDANLR